MHFIEAVLLGLLTPRFLGIALILMAAHFIMGLAGIGPYRRTSLTPSERPRNGIWIETRTSEGRQWHFEALPRPLERTPDGPWGPH